MPQILRGGGTPSEDVSSEEVTDKETTTEDTTNKDNTDENAPEEDTQDINIPNVYLKKLINITLEKDENAPVTKAEMESLTVLNDKKLEHLEGGSKLQTFGISDLTGLEYAINLEELVLERNEITDLTPISELPKIKKLNVNRNELVDISPLSKMKSLEWLDIYNNKIEDISPLRGLTNLKYIDMHYVNRQKKKIDITPLSGLTNLEYLSIESNLLHNEDIECLKAIAESGNLKTILLRANYITDFSLFKSMLNEYYIDKGGLESGEDNPVGTYGQRHDGDTEEVDAKSEGGQVEVNLPKIKGFEEVDAYIAEMYEVSTTYRIALSEEQDGISVEYNEENHSAVFDFNENIVGKKKDIDTDLVLKDEATDFTYSIPVHITQDVQYGFELGAVDYNKSILHMNTSEGNSVSEEEMVATIIDEKGNPVKLTEGSVEFKKAFGTKQEVFEAHNLRVEGNKIFFRIAGKEGAEIEEGNYTLKPTVKFKAEGDDNVYQAIDSTKVYNLYVSSVGTIELDDEIIFDLSKVNEDRTYTSEKFNIKLPENKEVRWLTVTNSKGNQVLTNNKGGIDSFELTLKPEELNDVFNIKITLKSVQKDSPVEVRNVKPRFIHSEKAEVIEKNFKTNLPEQLNVGDNLDVKVSYGIDACENIELVSSDENVLKVDGTKVTAIAEGKASLEIKNLAFNYTIDDETFHNVSYVPAITKDVTVVKKAEVVNPDPAPSKDPITNNKDNSGNVSTDVNLGDKVNTENGKADVKLDKDLADKVVENATANKSESVNINATAAGNAEKTEVSVPTETLKNIDTKTDAKKVTIKTDSGSVSMDKTALKAITEQAGSTENVKLVVETKESAEDKVVIELKLVTSNGEIHDFKGGKVTVTVPVKQTSGKKLVAVYIDDNGKYTKIGGKLTDAGFVFETGHFSQYAVMTEEVADAAIKAQEPEKPAKPVVKSVALTSVKAQKKAMKVTWKKSADKVSGYQVRYSTSKSFKTCKTVSVKYTKKVNSRTVKGLKSGKRYYVKVRTYVKNTDGTYYSKWSKVKSVKVK